MPGSEPAPFPHDRTHISDAKFEQDKKSKLALEVRWLKDPVKLADHTVTLLREDQFEKALDIVRLASRDVVSTVSWNHLIDYEMSKARVPNAVKLYNEMKKRAQLPDAYTFTILFRGFSWCPPNPQICSRALSIYQSMFAENSPVRPSIIHTNAVLKVCALAHDVDALLGIAAELPTRGSGAPNNLTFTTILNGIQSKAIEETNGQKATSRGEGTGRDKIRALAVHQGRRIWVDVRQRWMSGDLYLDEKLVCAMGRLLSLGGEPQDLDDILSLLEQTMGLPRQVARLADPALGRAGEASGPNDDLELLPRSPANVELETVLSSSREEDDFPELPSDPLAPLPKAAGATQSAVRPGRNTLSLVVDACVRLKCARAAQNYWGLLTSPDSDNRIIPDSENYHTYLRLLRLRRSAKLAVELVDELTSGDLTGKAGVETKTFRIALSCCVRDNKNRNSIFHAEKLVKIMTETLSYPDAKALGMYLQVALLQKPRDWRVIMSAIRGCELGVRNLRSLIAYEPGGPRKQNEEDILELVRGLISAIDVVLDLGNEEIDGKEKKRCRERRHMLAAYVTRTHHRRVAEGKSHEVKRGEDEGTGGKVLSPKRSRSGRRSDDHPNLDGEGENDGFEGERNEAVARRPAEEVSDGILGPGRGEWKREWEPRRRAQGWEKKDRETMDRESVDRGWAWKFQRGRNDERAERY